MAKLTCVLLALALAAAPALAQACGTRAAVAERLAGTYGETRQAVRRGPDNTLVELFASESSGSWTITVTSAGGLTCLVASGQAFGQPAAGVLPANPDDA